MKGNQKNNHQLEFGFCADDKVPEDHPIRGVKKFVEKVLYELRHDLEDMYSYKGRPSVPPETLLKSMLLMVLFSVRSERQFCSMLSYNLLYQWFLNMSVMDSSFDASVFSKNRVRLLEHDIARKFFEQVNEHLRTEGLIGNEYFSVDGTLIGAWASMSRLEKRDDDDYNNRIRGKKPSEIGVNDKKVSSTDAEAVVACKKNVLPHLAYMGNILMDNSSKLCADVEILPARGTAETEAALTMLRRCSSNEDKIISVGADANYHTAKFVSTCRDLGIKPHVVPQSRRNIKGLDGRTFISAGYKKSQTIRKEIEKLFGWLKYIGGWKRTRYRSNKKVSFYAIMGVCAFNIMRSIKLRPSLAY